MDSRETEIFIGCNGESENIRVLLGYRFYKAEPDRDNEPLPARVEICSAKIWDEVTEIFVPISAVVERYIIDICEKDDILQDEFVSLHI